MRKNDFYRAWESAIDRDDYRENRKMKTAFEVRQLIVKLDALLSCECECAGTDHELPCVLGRTVAKVSRQYLRWVLGEIPDSEIQAAFEWKSE